MATAGKRVLVVDDDLDFRASVTAVLEAQGYEVVGAASAKEGLSKIAAEHPDLKILDVIMEHDSSGYEVNQAVKFRDEFALSRDIPILMVSSIPLGPATRFSRASEVGMITPDYYKTKPLDMSDFVDRVRIMLESRSKRTSAQA